MSKLSDFLKKKKIDSRRLLVASKNVEALQPEDRSVKLLKKQAKGESASEAIKEASKKKPRSGRRLTSQGLKEALEGGTLSGPQKNRITRAVNHVLAWKKQDAITIRDLF